MNSIQKDLESRKTTMYCGGDLVAIYSTPIAGLWLANAVDCERVRADLKPPHRPSVWRFADSGALVLIESLPALDIAEIQGNSWIMSMIMEGAKHLKPIKIKFREYKKPEMSFAVEGIGRLGKPCGEP
jgi:hypothetical protein